MSKNQLPLTAMAHFEHCLYTIQNKDKTLSTLPPYTAAKENGVTDFNEES